MRTLCVFSAAVFAVGGLYEILAPPYAFHYVMYGLLMLVNSAAIAVLARRCQDDEDVG